MPTVELDIRQLADEGGTAPLAPITVTDAVLDEDGNTLTDTLDELKSGLTDLLKTVEVSFADTTLPTNALFQVTKTFDAGNGYAPVSIASYNLSRINGLYITRIQFGSTSVTIGGHNASSTSLLHGQVYVLCAKTSVL